MKSLRMLSATCLLLTALTVPASAGWMGTGAQPTPTPEVIQGSAITEDSGEGEPALATTSESYDTLDLVFEAAGSILIGALNLL